jgi:hypothetical protein
MSMPPKSNAADTIQFTITLPRATAVLLERLAETEVYGNTRATVAAEIIREHVRELWRIGKLPA